MVADLEMATMNWLGAEILVNGKKIGVVTNIKFKTEKSTRIVKRKRFKIPIKTTYVNTDLIKKIWGTPKKKSHGKSKRA
jgi:hypothetical protein